MMCCYDKLFFNNGKKNAVFFLHFKNINYFARNHDIFKLAVEEKSMGWLCVIYVYKNKILHSFLPDTKNIMVWYGTKHSSDFSFLFTLWHRSIA